MADRIPVKLRFAAVKTGDLARARLFYEDALGLPLTREEQEYVQLDAGGAKLCVDLSSNDPEDEPSLIFTTEDLDGLRKQLADEGYPAMEKYQSDRYFVVRDPDGTPVVFEDAKAVGEA